MESLTNMPAWLRFILHAVKAIALALTFPRNFHPVALLVWAAFFALVACVPPRWSVS
jgi:hypothetical protein